MNKKINAIIAILLFVCVTNKLLSMGAFDVAQVSNKQQAEQLIATFEQEQKDIAKAQADLNKAAQEAKGNTKTLTEISNLKIELAGRDKSIKGMVKTLQWMIKLNKYPGKK